jgi:glutathione S-transferase
LLRERAFRFNAGDDLFEDRVHVVPTAADGLETKARLAVRWLDGPHAGRTFLAGERFTIADVTLFTYVDLQRNGGQPMDPRRRSVAAWSARDRAAVRRQERPPRSTDGSPRLIRRA